MSRPVEGTDLQVDDDDAFQRADWRAQRIGWCLFAVALLAAMTGLFGGGPLSTATKEGDGWSIEYERFARRTKEQALTIRAHAQRQTIEIEFAGAILRQSRLESINPEPLSRIATTDGQRLTFAVSGSEPITIVIRFTPESAGQADGSVRIDGGEAKEFSTFVYP